jgi:hypothetical protein
MIAGIQRREQFKKNSHDYACVKEQTDLDGVATKIERSTLTLNGGMPHPPRATQWKSQAPVLRYLCH